MDLSGNPLWSNLLVFAIAAALVWRAGRSVTEYADELAHRYNLSRAFLGLFMLATISSLPEAATSFTAAANANAELAVNNLLGAIVLQVTLLAVADLFIGRQALTAVVPDPLVLLQGNLGIIMLALVVLAITAGDTQVFVAGAWSWGLIGAAGFVAFKLVRAGRHGKPWVVNPDAPGADEANAEEQRSLPRKHGATALPALYSKLVFAALAILGAGAVLAYTAEAIGMQTGMGQSFAGMVLLSAATCMPEMSMIFTSVRAGLYTMAISEVFGTSFVNVALIGVVDLVDGSRAVLDDLGTFSALAATLGIVVIGIFLAGLAERGNRTILRMGTDSLLVLIAYVAGLFLLYSVREGGA